MDSVAVIGVVATIIGGSVGIKELFVPWLTKKREERKQSAHWQQAFQRDWSGEPAAPGRDATPGVMERLNRLDGELRRNGGESLKDKVVDLHDKVDTMSKQMEDICKTQDLILEHLRGGEVVPLFPPKAI